MTRNQQMILDSAAEEIVACLKSEDESRYEGCILERVSDFTMLERDWFAKGEARSRRAERMLTAKAG